MTEKQPQTCYVLVDTPDWDEEFALSKAYLKSHVIPALNELPDRYILTKKELEAQNKELLIGLLQWMNDTTSKNPMLLETDNNDIVEMYLTNKK